MPNLSFVNDVNEIRESIHTFYNELIPNIDVATSIAKLSTYWVFDSYTNKFGPAKFVGFSNMNFNTYKIARTDNYTGDKFDGGVTKVEIENITGASFRKSHRLESELIEWISDHLGTNILENVNTSKWKFVTLPAPYSYWALMANPDIFSIEEAIKNMDGDCWTIEKSDIKQGDKCIIWKAKGRDNNRGIIALADVLTNPEIMDEPQEAKKFRKVQENDLPARRVKVKYNVPLSLPIWLDEDKTGTLKSLSVSKAAGGSVFKITPSQWEEITLLINEGSKPSANNSNKILLKVVGISQHQDGVRINKEFHEVFNPSSSPYYVARGNARGIAVEFNSKTFKADYRYEGTKASERDLQRIQFSKELKDEFIKVFPTANGFFSIKLGVDLNHFIFSFDSVEASEYSKDLENNVSKSRNDNKEARIKRLSSADKLPASVQVISVAYIRNADVIVEVLDRAKGICENCNANAPFLRRKDNTPYLEVHHKVPLSEGGFDTIDNAIAVCPNCHRESHFG